MTSKVLHLRSSALGHSSRSRSLGSAVHQRFNSSHSNWAVIDLDAHAQEFVIKI